MIDHSRIDITSPRNPRLRAVMRLGKRRDRDREGLFLIEGVREISRAIDGGVEISDAYTCPWSTSKEEEILLDTLRTMGIPVTTVTRRAFDKIVYREGSSGIVAAARKPDYTFERLAVPPDPLYLVVEAVEKPGNIGAILRSADGAGATGTIVCDPGTDLCNPNVIRASLGTVFTVPIAIATTEAAIEWLRRGEFAILAATPHADTIYTDADMRRGCAIVVGSEDRGVSERWLEAADVTVTVPMRGSADSLNVSTAAALIMYEALRQRTCG